MCGITGYIHIRKKIEREVIDKMVNTLHHRGPDDRGYEIIEENNSCIALGHVRLSILDLSQAGHQPMSFNDTTIVYNGEVYNFKEIRDELLKLGHSFISNTDTEVILHAYYEWGRECVNRFMGMFAIAIYDKRVHKLLLFRDRAGIKPLFYYHDDEKFVFGSELKAIMAVPEITKEIDLESLSMYLECGYVPDEKCILKHANKLEAGHLLEYNTENARIIIEKYWDIEYFYKKPKLTLTFEQAEEELRRLLIHSVKAHMISDVPVGIFLSGGFDSTLITSIVTKELGIVPNTFTIGFYEGQNEAPDAEEAAKILGTNHITEYCTYKEAQEIIPQLPYFYDEPSSDISAIPTILVSRMARKHVKVVLSADGGDELFAGYNHHHNLAVTYNQIKTCKQRVRYLYYRMRQKRYHSFLAHDDYWNNWLYMHQSFYNSRGQSVKDLVLSAFEYEKSAADYVFPSGRLFDARRILGKYDTMSDELQYDLLFNFHSLLKNWYLTKVDRASMSTSLESREPLLDHRIMEFAAQLPWDYKYKDGVKKRIERSLVYRYLPRELMDKPKRGFAIPLYGWLQKDLKDYVMSTLSPANIEAAGLDKDHVSNVLNWFMNGGPGFHYDIHGSSNLLWRIIQYVAWHEMWIKGKLAN